MDSSALEFELSELRDAITDIDRQLSLMEGDLEIVNGNIKTLQSEKVAIDASKKSITSKIKREENRLEDIVNMLENRKKEISKLEKDVQLAEMKHAEACKVIQKQEDEFAKRISLAEEKTRDLVEGWDGEPLPLSRKDTKAELDKAIIRLRAKIQKHKEKEGLQDYTSATLTEKLNKAVADYEEHSQGYKALKNKIAELTDDNLKREELWSTQIRRYGKMVTKQFDVYMQKRGFSGSVSFDHENKKLLIKSQTDSYDENSKCNDVRQLSGGERSYTTLCLLMALGHVIECPFRLMDEYDVFLDQVVRKITLMELMRYALAPEQRGRQFIILTPQELSDVKVTNSVRICRIRPPERVTSRGPQQTTL